MPPLKAPYAQGLSMPDKPDAARIVAETLAGMLAAGGTAAATAAGAPVVLVGMGAAAVKGLFKYVVAHMPGRPDPKGLLQRIRDERTSHTVETIRDALVEAMGLKPQFAEPIEELADAVQAREDGRDEARFQSALLKLFTTVTEIAATLKDIKADTAYIPEVHSTVKDNQDRLKRIEAAMVAPQVSGEGEHGTQQYLRTRVESLTSEVRDLLDANGRAKWDQVSTAIAEHSWQQAFELAAEMERWLDDQGDRISDEVKIQGLLILADVAVIRDSGFPFDDRQDISEASRLLAKAEATATPDIEGETASRLLRARAKLVYIEGDHGRAFEIIDGLDDPGTISLRLGMMGEEGNWAEASDLAAAQSEPHRRWAASAVVAHVKVERADHAEAILEWSRGQEALTKKSCALAFVKAKYTGIIGEGMGISLLSLTQADRVLLGQLRTLVGETFGAALTDGPSSGIDAEALEMAIMLGHVLREFQACQDAADQLVKWQPVMPEMGRAVLRGDVAAVDGLAGRFLDEHGDTFLTQMLAAMLMVEVEGDAKRALDLLLPMLDSAAVPQREEIATTVLIGAQYCDVGTVRGAHQCVSEALGDEHRRALMLRAVLLAKEGSLGEAQSVIEPLADDDDHIWLQLAASIATQQNAWSDAAQLLHRISEATGHVEVYRKEAEAWYRANQAMNCVEPLEKAHQLQPDDGETIRNLAAAYHLAGRFVEAAAKYNTVWQAQEHTQALAINYSNALVLNGNVAKAIEILNAYLLEAGDQAELAPLLACAHLLHTQDDAGGALGLLLPHSDRFDGDHRYLMAVMQLAYASGREEEAGKALEKLVGMLNQGALPEGVMWKTTTDDIQKMHDEWNERRKHVDGLHLSGRLPWLIASNWIQPANHSFLSWLIRTQPLVPSDHPESTAEYSLYSTNSFTAIDANGHRHLAPITAPDKGAEIVADMSALITLHRLGLLQTACAYFDKVYLPRSYRAAWLEEQARIPHHQPRQVESRQAIIRAVREGRILVATDEHVTAPRLDEYEKDAQGPTPVVRILQIVKWLCSSGRLSVEQRTNVESRHNQPGLISDTDANLALDAGMVVVRPLTLQTIHDWELLDDLCQGLRVFVEPDDLREIETALRNQEACDQAGQWYRELVSTIGSTSNVEFIPLNTDSGESCDEDGQNEDDGHDRVVIHLGIDAAVLAQQMNLPLLADDRYCQQGLLGSRPDDPQAAFGVATLIAGLRADGQITPRDHADHFLQLAKWRYKFLLPPVGVLLEMASRFRDGLPGAQLREVASYAQDCMRDVGLYGGPEQVDPPISMAMRLFKAWIDTLADFIVNLWWDERFTEEQAARLTRWASRYLMPAWPCNIPSASWRRAAYVRRYALLGCLVTNLLQKEDVRKAYRVVDCVRRSIGLREEELASAAESASEAMIRVMSDQDEEIVRSILVRVFKTVYGDRPEIPWRLLPVAQRAGLIDSSNVASDVLEEQVSVIQDRNHAKRLAPLEGPFAYCLEGDKHALVTFLPEALCSSRTDLRRAVLGNLLPQGFCPKTKSTQSLLEQEADDIRADNVETWVPAVGRILEPIQEDFLLNMAGFSQGQERHHDDACSKCWTHLICPMAESLLAIDRDGWSLLPFGGKAEAGLLTILSEAGTLEELLTVYDRSAGHLTLAPPHDLGTQIQEFVTRSVNTDGVWPGLQEWLHDQHRPWRQYHACQALLCNGELVPPDQQEAFWNLLAEIAELSAIDKVDSDEAQVWRLEAELAANYLRTVDLGGYGLEANRPLTSSWWAARTVTELLTCNLPAENVAEQIRQWRSDPILRGTLLIHDAWGWLSPKAYSPARFATLNEMTPRSIALLVATGEFARSVGVESIPASVRARLRECFCAALVIGDTAVVTDEQGLWMWEYSLVESAKAFLAALPDEEQTDLAAQAIGFVDSLADPASLTRSLEQLITTSEADALFLCIGIRTHCYRNQNAGDIIRPFLRDAEWRDTCAKRIPMLGWDMIAQGLLVLQTRNGTDWAVEVPYVFLRLAEASCDDDDRATGFLTYLVMSAASSNTGGALKALLRSERLLKLRPLAKKVKSRIEEIAEVADPTIRLRLQMILTLLDQL